MFSLQSNTKRQHTSETELLNNLQLHNTIYKRWVMFAWSTCAKLTPRNVQIVPVSPCLSFKKRAFWLDLKKVRQKMILNALQVSMHYLEQESAF